MIAHAATKPVGSIDCPALALEGLDAPAQVLIRWARIEKFTAGAAEHGGTGR